MEAEPLVAVNFSFGYHLPEDISRLPKIRQQAETFFLPHSNNVYVKEDVAFSDPMAISLYSEYQRTGSYLDAYLQTVNLQQHRRRIAQGELEYVRARSLSAAQIRTGNDVTNMMTVGAAFLFQEFDILDELSKSRQFRLVIESYPEAETRRFTRIYKRQHERLHQAYLTSLKGAAEPAVELFRESVVLQAEPLPKRNRGYIDRIASIIVDAISNEKPSRIFVRIGETHHVIADRLSDYARLQAPSVKNRLIISSTFDFGQPLESPSDRLVQALEADSNLVPADEQIYQAVIGIIVDWNLYALGNPRPERVAKANKVAILSNPEDILQLIRTFPAQGFNRAVGEFTYSKIY